MEKMRIELSYDGIGQMLRGSEMQSLMESLGAERSIRAGNGYSHRVHNTGQRQAANVYAATPEAVQDNFDNNTLLKVLK